MKVALCISGQPRSLQQNIPYIQESLIKPNNADVFLHSWIDPESSDHVYHPRWIETKKGEKFLSEPQHPNVDYVAIKEYEPKGAWFEPPAKTFPHYREEYESMSGHDVPVFDTYSMYASIFKANQVKRMYEQKHGFRYDYVIRTRFDICLHLKLPVTNLSRTCFHTGNGFVSPIGIHDHVIVANSRMMDEICDTYLYMEQILQNSGLLCHGEMYLGYFARYIRNLQAKIITGINTIDGRFNGMYQAVPYMQLDEMSTKFSISDYPDMEEELKQFADENPEIFSKDHREELFERIIGKPEKQGAWVQ